MPCKGKLSKSVSFPVPTRYEWSKAYPARPKDSLIAHQDSQVKQPFRPSYEMHGDPTMDCLIDWSYGRIWQTEVQDYRQNRKNATREKSSKKKDPIYVNRKPAPVELSKPRSTMKRFQNVPAKVQTGLALPPAPMRYC